MRFSSQLNGVVIHMTQQFFQVNFHKVKMVVSVNTPKMDTKIIAENP